MQTIFNHIVQSIQNNYYNDLGNVELIRENDRIDDLKIKIIPHEGIHQNVPYIINIKFQELNEWPMVYIDSPKFNQILTKRYLENRGYNGDHKGICIKNLSHGYNFHSNFSKICGNKWENYIYNLIVFFNNIQDFEKGIGIKSNYKQILNIL